LAVELVEPTLHDVFKAEKVISSYLHSTPLVESRALSKELNCRAYLKLENLQPIGAFKIRGGINLVSSLTSEERERGLVTASTGNHGQSIAYAGRAFKVKTVIVLPEGANPYKIEAIRELGAEIIIHGKDFDDARLKAEKMSIDEGYRYVHSANEPLLIAGVATATLEVLREVPDVDVIVVPIGSGSGACGACIVAKTINPDIKVVGVQAEKAPAVYLSWRNKRLMTTESAETFADGLASRVAFELPFKILCRLIDDIVLVSEEELRRAIIYLLFKAHQVAEAAGAASTAAAFKLKEEIAGKKVALMLSGGNISIETLRKILAC